MTADWEPDATQEGVAVDEPREGIEAPADGTTVELPAELRPGDDGGAGERMATDGDRALAVAMQLNAYEDVVGAIRMAMVAAADQHSQVKLIERLLTYAPELNPRATGPTKLLLDAIRDEQAQVTVPATF